MNSDYIVIALRLVYAGDGEDLGKQVECSHIIIRADQVIIKTSTK